MENAEIDIAPYIAGITKRWYWVILGILLTAIPAALLLVRQPPTYSATASVLMLIRQTGSQIGVDQPLVSIETIDAASRRQGLLALSQSAAVEARLPNQVIEQVGLANYRPGLFVQNGLIRVNSDGDLITISAQASSAERAKLLADAWATTYVDYVQTLYTDEHSRVQLASEALLPLEPNSPNIVRNTVIAGVLGAMVGLFAVIMQTFLATRAKQPARVVHEPAAAVTSINRSA